MKIKFKSTGEPNKLISWLNGFKEIEPSLLIEVDIKDSCFVAKSFPQDHTIIKYSKISFTQAGYSLDAIIDNNDEDITKTWNQKYGQRIKVGLWGILSGFVDVVSEVEKVDHFMEITFYYKELVDGIEYHSTDIFMKSKTKKLHVETANISDFFVELPDSKFMAICNLANPMHFRISEASIKELNSVSNIKGISSIDANKDSITFYTKMEQDENGQTLPDSQYAIYAKDGNQSKSSYNILLGYVVDEDSASCVESEVTVSKKNFIKATKGISGEDVTITLDSTPDVKMILSYGFSTIIIAGQRNY